MTAVEYFFNELQRMQYFIGNDMLEAYKQSKQLEKQQIIDAFDEGQEYEYQYHINNTPKFDSQTYYAETYGSDVTSDFDKPFMDFAKQYVENLKTKNK